jgi:hypothetical protein
VYVRFITCSLWFNPASGEQVVAHCVYHSSFTYAVLLDCRCFVIKPWCDTVPHVDFNAVVICGYKVFTNIIRLVVSG